MKNLTFGLTRKVEEQFIDLDKTTELKHINISSYIAISWYFLQIAFSVYFIYGGLIGAVSPLIANIIWLVVWSLYFSYLCSLLGKSYDYLENGTEVRWNGKI